MDGHIGRQLVKAVVLGDVVPLGLRKQSLGDGQVSAQSLESGLGDEGVLHHHGSAHAPAGAGVELHEFQARDIAVVQLLQHAVDVLDAVRRQVLIVEECRSLSPRRGPADADHARLGQILRLLAAAHDVDEAEINVADGQDLVHLALVVPEPVADVADLTGAGGDKAYADILPRQLGVLLHGALQSQLSGDLHGGKDLHDMLLQGGIPQGYQTKHDGTGGVDDGLGDAHGLEVGPGVGRDQLGGLGYLVDVVESDVLESLQDVVHVLQILKLSVQGRRG